VTLAGVVEACAQKVEAAGCSCSPRVWFERGYAGPPEGCPPARHHGPRCPIALAEALRRRP
jgi:hypothetical protein